MKSSSWHSWIYTSDELTRKFQNFSDEHHYIRNTRMLSNGSIYRPVVRIVMLVILSCQIAFSISEWGLHDMFTYLTNLATMLTWLNIALTLKCSLDIDIEKKKTWLVLNHLTFEIISSLNIMVVAFYWPIIHPERMKDPYFYTNTHYLVAICLNHSTPLAFTLINFFLTDIYVASSHWKPLLPLTAAYLTVNYFESKQKGKPLYPFLTWEANLT